jgi:hypothetical protein
MVEQRAECFRSNGYLWVQIEPSLEIKCGHDRCVRPRGLVDATHSVDGDVLDQVILLKNLGHSRRCSFVDCRTLRCIRHGSLQFNGSHLDGREGNGTKCRTEVGLRYGLGQSLHAASTTDQAVS